MSRRFVVPASRKPDQFGIRGSVGEVETVEFDLTPWQEDNNTITTVTWTVEAGAATISGQALASGVASAQITFPSAGNSLISILADTGTEKLKLWLQTYAADLNNFTDDYGLT